MAVTDIISAVETRRTMILPQWLALAIWGGPTLVGVMIFIGDDMIKKLPRRGVILGTLGWVIPLSCLLAYSLAKRAGMAHNHLDFNFFVLIRILGSAVMIILGAYGIIRAASLASSTSGSKPTAWSAYDSLVFLAIFWALLPPTWFFAEYFAFDSKAVAIPSDMCHKDYMENLKQYADLASKVWAGFGALYAALLSQIK